MEDKIWRLVLTIGLFFFLYILSAFLLGLVQTAYIKLLLLIAFGMVSVLVSMYVFPYPIKEFYTLGSGNRLLSFAIAFGVPLISFGSTLLYLVVWQPQIEMAFNTSNILGNLVLQFFVALNEELFFRALLFYSVYKLSKNFAFAAILSASIFALVHYPSFTAEYVYFQIASLLMVGIASSSVLLYFGSIWPCIAWHYCHNILVKLFTIDLPKDVDYASTVLNYVVEFIITIWLVWMLNLWKKKREAEGVRNGVKA